MEMQMKWEKVVSPDVDGLKGYKLVAIDGILHRSEYPYDYRNGYPCMYLWDPFMEGGADAILTFDVWDDIDDPDSSVCVHLGDVVSEKKYKKISALFQECADRLAEITDRQHKLEKTWKGEKIWHPGKRAWMRKHLRTELRLQEEAIYSVFPENEWYNLKEFPSLPSKEFWIVSQKLGAQLLRNGEMVYPMTNHGMDYIWANMEGSDDVLEKIYEEAVEKIYDV